MKTRPTPAEAAEAEHTLDTAILQFSDEARAPWEHGKPNPNPTWIPRVSTLRFSPLRKGGWIWSMNANDQQIVAYYVAPDGDDPFNRVTGHGQARHNFHEKLRQQRLYTTATPSHQWYDYRAQYDLNDKMSKKVVW